MNDDDQFIIDWIDRGRPPQNMPDPDYPNGVHRDCRKSPDQPSCLVILPYPSGHKNIGHWRLNCRRCGFIALVSAASRPDDPRSVSINCREPRGN